MDYSALRRAPVRQSSAGDGEFRVQLFSIWIRGLRRGCSPAIRENLVLFRAGRLVIMTLDHVSVPSRRVLEALLAVVALVRCLARAISRTRMRQMPMKRVNVGIDSLSIEVRVQIALLGKALSTVAAHAGPGRQKSAPYSGNLRASGAPELQVLGFNVSLDEMLLRVVAARLGCSIAQFHFPDAVVLGGRSRVRRRHGVPHPFIPPRILLPIHPERCEGRGGVGRY